MINKLLLSAAIVALTAAPALAQISFSADLRCEPANACGSQCGCGHPGVSDCGCADTTGCGCGIAGNRGRNIVRNIGGGGLQNRRGGGLFSRFGGGQNDNCGCGTGAPSCECGARGCASGGCGEASGCGGCGEASGCGGCGEASGCGGCGEASGCGGCGEASGCGCGSAREPVGQSYFQEGTGCGCGGNVYDGGCAQTCNDSCGSSRYISRFGGWNGARDFVIDNGGTENRTTFKEGYVLGTAFGREIGCNRRVELEFASRKNSADEFLVDVAPNIIASDISGDVRAYSAMFNILQDSDRCILGATPYVGGGFGAMYMDGDIFDANNNCNLDELVLAYQAIVGASRKVNSRVSVFTEYRFLGTTDFDVPCTDLVGLTTTTETDYTAESVVFGFRMRR